MAISEADFDRANERANQRTGPVAVAARYLPARGRLVVVLSTGAELSVPVSGIEGLSGSDADALREIEITPSGLGLHFPRLDADVYVPALLEGVTGSARWMAQQLGRTGGTSTSQAKAEAAQRNGKLGGRPRSRVRERTG